MSIRPLEKVDMDILAAAAGPSVSEDRTWSGMDGRATGMDGFFKRDERRVSTVIIRVKSYVAFTSASVPCHPFVFCVSPLKIDYPVSVKNGPSRCPSFLSCRSGGSPVTDSNIPPLTSEL